MKNGRLETWQVMKWLKKHPKHKGEAPETDRRRAQRVKTALRGEVVFWFLSRTRGWTVDSFPSHRSDWTIYNEHDEQVEFKKKARVIDTGVPVNREDLIRVCSRNSDHVFARIVVTVEGGTILIRRRKA